ncbi:MAG: 2-phosphotransferase, Tpt1 / KptA family [Cyanobacteriota bacterium]|jgi:RNA:NAD 2'-phosphotransferase (TPT1/KptA family)
MNINSGDLFINSQAEKKELTKVSKFLSLILRHKPEIIGLTLNEQKLAKVE